MNLLPDSLDIATIMTCALLSSDVYQEFPLQSQPLLANWQCISEANYLMSKWTNTKINSLIQGSYLLNQASKYLLKKVDMQWPKDFFARLYYHERKRQAVIAYRGTNPIRIGTVFSDLEIGMKHYGSYDLAATYFFSIAMKLLQEKMPEISLPPLVTGHSLGGYLAQVVADYYQNEQVIAIVFNAPGTGGLYNSELHRKVNGYNPRIYNIVNRMDLIHLSGGGQAGQIIYLDHDDFCSQEMQNYQHHEEVFFHDMNLSALHKMEEFYYLESLAPLYSLCGIWVEHSIVKLIANLKKTAVDGSS